MIITTQSIPLPEKDIIPLTSPVGIGNSISNTNRLPGIDTLINSQFPQFVSEDHPAFIEFMEAYYSWMDSKGMPLHEARRLLENQDIDTISEEYERGLFNEFLAILPQNFLGDRSIVLKNIKQFYGAKGTEKSFKFLFRILFNADSYLYYPKVDILRVSDGKWIQNKTVRLTNITGDVRLLRAQRIRGRTTNTVAFVERLYGINIASATAHELILNTASITGNFEPGEIVECSVVDERGAVTIITGKISPIVSGVKIIRSGFGYSLGDTFPVQDTFGRGAIIRVSAVDEDGVILECNIKEYGIGYNVINPPSQIRLLNAAHPEFSDGGSFNPSVAVVNLVLGSTTNYPGYFRNSDGQLSTNKYLHDGFFYQQYSYVTFTERSYNEYVEVMNRVVHPIGFKHFGGLSLISFATATAQRGDEYTHIKQIFQRQLDASVNAKTHVIPILPNKSKNSLGPSYESVLRDKFSYKPFIKYDANRELIQQNPPYYGTGLLGKTASTPVSTFEIEKLGVNKPKTLDDNRDKKIRLFPDSCIIQNPDRLVVSTQHTLSKNVISVSQGDMATVEFGVTNLTGGDYIWIIKKNGLEIQQGTGTDSAVISTQIAAENCRIALFVTDNMGRTYKSDNVFVKIME